MRNGRRLAGQATMIRHPCARRIKLRESTVSVSVLEVLKHPYDKMGCVLPVLTGSSEPSGSSRSQNRGWKTLPA